MYLNRLRTSAELIQLTILNVPKKGFFKIEFH